MTRKYNFIAGLPRSGSTLLSSILNQNPRFTASITDPLCQYTSGIIDTTDRISGIHTMVPPIRLKKILRGIFDIFFDEGKEVCFSTNRSWPVHVDVLADLFPNFKMILCVREIPYIMDSFERLNSKSPYATKSIYGHKFLPTVYDRINMLMGHTDTGEGYVKSPLMNVVQAITSIHASHICVVEYEQLAISPKHTMQKIYKFLQEEYFPHDYSNVGARYPSYDEHIGFQDLHTVRERVEYIPRDICLPADIIDDLNNYSFWKLNPSIKEKVFWIG